MSFVVTAVSPELQTLYAPIAEHLAQVERELAARLKHRHAFVQELISHGAALGGKRLRPALLLLSAKAIDRVFPEHIVLAAVLEMIHTASLVHDDVLDQASLRRNLATVNSRWDNETAVLLGDYLFTHAFHTAAEIGATACRVIGEATDRVCAGEIRQKGARGDYSMPESDYWEIVEGKTGALTECACRLGALYAQASHGHTLALAAYGLHLGRAFQAADDLLDLEGDAKRVGKTLGTDLQQRRATLPLIFAFREAAPRDRDTLHAMLVAGEGFDPAEILAILRRCGALEYARAAALSAAAEAQRAIAELPPSSARDTLNIWAIAAVERVR